MPHRLKYSHVRVKGRRRRKEIAYKSNVCVSVCLLGETERQKEYSTVNAQCIFSIHNSKLMNY